MTPDPTTRSTRARRSQGDNAAAATGPAVATLLVLAAGLILASCASGGPSGSLSATRSAAPACQRIAEVLDMSPDSSADPSGYALFQIEPFGSIHTPDPVLSRALKATVLADDTIADEHSSPGAVAAAGRVADTETRLINSQCPGLDMGT